MKKLAFVLLSVSATVFGLGMVAEAQQVPYDNTSRSGAITLSPATALVGSSVTVGVTGCTPDEVLTVAVDDVTGATTTCNASGGANVAITAPTAVGSHSVSVAGDQGFAANAELVVTAVASAAPASGGLPATGSDGIGTTVALAAGLLAVGAALFVVAQLRRRRNVTVA
jgi:hypothetical protein